MTVVLGTEEDDVTSESEWMKWRAKMDGKNIFVVVHHDVLDDCVIESRIRDMRLAENLKPMMERAAANALLGGRELTQQIEPGTQIAKTPWLILKRADF